MFMIKRGDDATGTLRDSAKVFTEDTIIATYNSRVHVCSLKKFAKFHSMATTIRDIGLGPLVSHTYSGGPLSTPDENI